MKAAPAPAEPVREVSRRAYVVASCLFVCLFLRSAILARVHTRPTVYISED